MSSKVLFVAGAGVAAAVATLLWIRRLEAESQATLPPAMSAPLANTVRYELSSGKADAKPNRGVEAPETSTSSDWPCLFGPDHNSVSYETGLVTEWGPDGPPELWRRDVGTGYSAPVVSGKRLLIHHRIGGEERLTAFDAASGATLWEHATPTSYRCRFAYSSGPYATPVVDGGFVFALTAQGRLLAVDFETGELGWERDLQIEYDAPEPLFGVGASPCCDGERLYLNVGGRTGHSGIVALEMATGRTLWTATDDGASYATPVLATIYGRRSLFAFTEQGLAALDPETGAVRWKVPFGNDAGPDRANSVTPIVANDLVFITSGPGPGSLCLRVLPDGSYEEVWRDRRVLDSQFNNVVLHDGCLFGFTSKWRRASALRCIELETGKMRWEWRSDLQRGSLVAVDGRLIALGEHGHLAAMELNTQEAVVTSLTSEPLLESPSYSAPALANGRLYLRNEKRVLCLSLRR